jgi:hypothetical protein
VNSNPLATEHCDPATVQAAATLANEGYSLYGFVLRRDGDECAIAAQHGIRHLTFDQLHELIHESAIDSLRFAVVQKRLFKLEAAIRKHRKQTMHEMCWENDEELWTTIEDTEQIDHTPPPWCEFMQKCAAYRASKER